jgi:hypothetical protein
MRSPSSLIDILRPAGRKLSFGKQTAKAPRPVRRLGDDPFIDWAFILSVSAVLALSLITIGVWIYVAGPKDFSAVPGSPAASVGAGFDADGPSRVIGAFDARASERVVLDKGFSGPPDPSLP